MPRLTALEALVSSMTIADLSERSGKSVEEIVDWAMKGQGGTRKSTRTNGVAAAPAAESGGSRRRRSGSVNTRTPAGREAYDGSVLSSVQDASGPIGAAAIRKKVGGTPLQVRAALNRLIDKGQVTYQGRARATRYSPA